MMADLHPQGWCTWRVRHSERRLGSGRMLPRPFSSPPYLSFCGSDPLGTLFNTGVPHSRMRLGNVSRVFNGTSTGQSFGLSMGCVGRSICFSILVLKTNRPHDHRRLLTSVSFDFACADGAFLFYCDRNL